MKAHAPAPASLEIRRKQGDGKAGCSCAEKKDRQAGAGCAVCHGGRVQRMAAAPGAVPGPPPIVAEVLSTPGQPLDASTRGFMESTFGHDFSRVRVHTDARAVASADAIQAQAYTAGSHIAFARGSFAPYTSHGRELLAHELAHVVQQRSAVQRAGAPLQVAPAGDPLEREAQAVATRVAHGERVAYTPGEHPAAIRRAVREGVVSSFQPGAQACLVHLHGNEENALQVAQEMHRDRCANLVHLNSTTRHVHVDVSSGGTTTTCEADPNRVFTDAAVGAHAIQTGCSNPARRQAIADVIRWRDAELNPAISRCRGGGGQGLSGPLPVVALHNNTPGALSIQSYQPGGSEAGATETARARTGGRANPSILSGTGADPFRLRDPDNFLLVTDPADFSALRGGFNVVLQHSAPTADGSLSVALAGERYINVEAEGKPFVSATDAAFVTNREMAIRVLDQLGVGRAPCSSPAGGQGAPDRGTPQGKPSAADQMRDPNRPSPEPAPAPEPVTLEEIIEGLRRLLREILRVLQQWGTMPEPLPRESPPANLPAACATFHSQANLDARKTFWEGTIAGMPAADVVNWIIGLNRPPVAAIDEATQQKDCLIHAIRASAARPGSPLSLPAGAPVRSDYRSFATQRAIWERKFEFRGAPFDSISDHARTTCGSLIGAGEVRWDPANPHHRVCWGAPASRGSTPPAVPAGARSLTDDEKQREILQASSAPGISRHHFGTDFDFFDPNLNPANWEAGRPFADEYAWLMRNASTYGFIQSFTATSAFMALGYMEERWHWSYYPVAQALVDFARSHQSDIEAALLAQWGTARQFSFIRAHWRDFVFNVSESARF
jgi:hypothetical protein